MEQRKTKKGVQKRGHYQKQQSQTTQKKARQAQDGLMKYLCLFIVVLVFTFAFMLLINKQKDSYMNDINEGSFEVRPKEGEVIVARDMEAIYPKYYVVYFSDDNFTIYSYSYYDTVSQYELEYNRLINSVVDYNEKDKMIRCLIDRGYGTYEEVLDNLSMLVDASNLKIYY